MSTQKHAVCLVTGASKGIGAAIALRLAADGFAVVVNYRSDAAGASKVVAQIEAAGGTARAVQADVSERAAVSKLFDTIERDLGPVDVLVNNAGILKMTPIAETDEAEFDRLLSVNIKACFNTMQEAARRLSDGGRIINLSSSVVGLLLPNYGVYAASKAAVETMAKVLSKELRGRNICVNSVAPGPTQTELFMEGKSEAFVEQLSKMAPLERLGQPEDIASVVAFLAGPDGAWVNGQVLRANGGII